MLMLFSKSPGTPVRYEPAGTRELPRALLEADVFISSPVLKTHAVSSSTGALKNQWGCLPPYGRILVQKYLGPILVTLHRIFHLALSVINGIIAMEGRGPANGKPGRLDVILASRDAMPLGATAMRLIGLEPDRSRHVVLPSAAGLGRAELGPIEVDGDGRDTRPSSSQPSATRPPLRWSI
jgi:uncharacterized protein (DUF362 family)